MLAHKTRPRSNAFSGAFLVSLVAIAVVLVALALPKVLTFANENGSTNGFSTYHSDTFRYSVTYPANWKVAPTVAGTDVTTISSVLVDPEQAGGRYSLRSLSRTPVSISNRNFSKLDIVAYSLEAPMTARELLSTRSSTSIDGRISSLQVAGQNALMVEVQTGEMLSQREENLIYKTVFVTKGNTGFIIAGFAEPEVFNRILQSFQID